MKNCKDLNIKKCLTCKNETIKSFGECAVIFYCERLLQEKFQLNEKTFLEKECYHYSKQPESYGLLYLYEALKQTDENLYFFFQKLMILK